MKVVHVTSILTSGLACMMAWGCVTMSSSTAKHASGDPIVMRAGADDPVIAKLDRMSWVEIRKSEKDEEYRLYTALGTSDWQIAAQDAKAYLVKHPKNRTALSVLSTSYAMQMNFDLALYYARLVQKYHGNNEADIENFTGLARMHGNKPAQADFVAAQHHFENAFDGGSGQLAAGFNLAHLHLIMGNGGEAQKIFGSLTGKCHGCLDAQIGLGLAYNKQHKYEDAKRTFLAVLQTQPTNTIALFRLALIEKNGFHRPDKAMDYLKTILADTSTGGLDIKRQANNLLNTMQAAEVGKEEMAAQDNKADDAEEKADMRQDNAKLSVEPASVKVEDDNTAR